MLDHLDQDGREQGEEVSYRSSGMRAWPGIQSGRRAGMTGQLLAMTWPHCGDARAFTTVVSFSWSAFIRLASSLERHRLARDVGDRELALHVGIFQRLVDAVVDFFDDARPASLPARRCRTRRHRTRRVAGFRDGRHVGQIGTRFSVNTASGLTVPSLICGSASASDTISKCIRLVIRSTSAGGWPL